VSASWTRAALSDLAAIHAHITADNAAAANTLRDRAIQFVETVLAVQPGIGRPGRVEGTREAVIHPSYIMVYRVKEGVVEILAVRHVARRWPGSF
jgi:toxin ParE1/3/4